MHELFSGGPNRGVLGADQKAHVDKVYVLSPSLTVGSHSNFHMFLYINSVSTAGPINAKLYNI